MKKLWRAMMLGLILAGACGQSAMACPMCKLANESKQKSEEENLRPKAYMYSILFMLAMPATLVTAFGIGLYQLSKQRDAAVSTSESEAA